MLGLSFSNRFVALMYLAKLLAISCVPNSDSIVISLRSLLARCVSAHLSCAYDGQRSRKCSGDSSSSPQAGHLALSTLLMRLRYWFMGACPNLNCAIRLASTRLSSVWLTVLRNFLDGVVPLMRVALCPLTEAVHLSFHFFFRSLWKSLFTAGGLVSRGFQGMEVKSACLKFFPPPLFSLHDLRPRFLEFPHVQPSNEWSACNYLSAFSFAPCLLPSRFLLQGGGPGSLGQSGKCRSLPGCPLSTRGLCCCGFRC